MSMRMTWNGFLGELVRWQTVTLSSTAKWVHCAVVSASSHLPVVASSDPLHPATRNAANRPPHSTAARGSRSRFDELIDSMHPLCARLRDRGISTIANLPAHVMYGGVPKR